MKETLNRMIGWTLEGIPDTMTNKEANKVVPEESAGPAELEEMEEQAELEEQEERQEVLAVWGEQAELEEVAAVWAEAAEVEVVGEVERKELVRYLFLIYKLYG